MRAIETKKETYGAFVHQNTKAETDIVYTMYGFATLNDKKCVYYIQETSNGNACIPAWTDGTIAEVGGG